VSWLQVPVTSPVVVQLLVTTDLARLGPGRFRQADTSDKFTRGLSLIGAMVSGVRGLLHKRAQVHPPVGHWSSSDSPGSRKPESCPNPDQWPPASARLAQALLRARRRDDGSIERHHHLSRHRPEAASAEPQRMPMPPMSRRSPIFPIESGWRISGIPAKRMICGPVFRNWKTRAPLVFAQRFRNGACSTRIAEGFISPTRAPTEQDHSICDRDDHFPPVGASKKPQSSSSTP
jgi:hypothetical protein